MPIPLLTTKLFIPPKRANTIERPFLVEKLLSGVDRPGNFALLSGPAGFGKSTLLSDFIDRLQRPTAWVSLDEGDNDFARYWTYLIHACQSVQPGMGETALELLNLPQALPDDTVPTLLINDFVAQGSPVVLVLDDYHEIRNPSVHSSLQFLLEHLPDNLYIVVSTRIDPPWPLARFRARHQLIEMRAQDLRFNSEETANFLNHTMSLDLSRKDVKALEDRTEGWAAGLQLAALSMQNRLDIPAFVEALTGSHVFVAEYLVEEVLERQPEDIQSFLLQTSILKRMNAGLCEAVTGCQDGQGTLRLLLKGNIFVIPLDNKGEWFRYHHLFSDLLQARLRGELPSDAIRQMHRRASTWYEHNGFPRDAISHAIEANDPDRAAGLVKRSARALIFNGQVSMLRNWLDALPQSVFQAHPHLTFYRFWIDVLQSKANLSGGAVQEIEEQLKTLPASPENDQLRGELMAVVCRAITFSGRTSEGIRLAHAALAFLPPDDLASRARTLSALATAYDLEGQAEEAVPAYQQAFSLAQAAGDYRLAAHTLMAKGLTQLHYGQLHKALKTFQAIIDMGEAAASAPSYGTRANAGDKALANKPFFPAGQGYIGLAGIQLERYELKTAEKYLNQGIELCRQGGLDGVFTGMVQLSRLQQAKGDFESALEVIQRQQQAFQRADDFSIATRHIQIELARSDVDRAWRWAAPFAEILKSEPPNIPLPLLFFETIEAIMARVYLAQGETGKALKLLDRLQATAEPGGRFGRLIEVHLLRALAYQQGNQGKITPEIIEHIGQALALGAPEGYVLLFLEEGPALQSLLQVLTSRKAAPDRVRNYARRLLQAFDQRGGPSAPRPAAEAEGLVEPLTPREMEVLERLAAGYTNQMIADALFITVRTVKKHTSNIYGKLAANSRLQAVARAHELGLLSRNEPY